MGTVGAELRQGTWGPRREKEDKKCAGGKDILRKEAKARRKGREAHPTAQGNLMQEADHPEAAGRTVIPVLVERGLLLPPTGNLFEALPPAGKRIARSALSI